MVAVLCVGLLLVLIALLGVVAHYRDANRLLLLQQAQRDQQHHESLLRALRLASRKTDSAALLIAADAWESVEERMHLERLAREQYQPGGPSMPAIWLRDRAESLHPSKK